MSDVTDGCRSPAGEQARVLKVVLAINALLFVVEATAGLLARSTALLADSLDMLGDALVYGFSLSIVSRTLRWKAVGALLKGAIMALFGLAVLGKALYQAFAGGLPEAQTMGIVGLSVLMGNGVCFWLLFRRRHDDLNMRSTWLCSRNDIAANLAVLVAAAGVARLRSAWPDVVVGSAIAVLFLHTALGVLRESLAALRPMPGQGTT